MLFVALPAQADWQTRSWSRWETGPRGATVLVGIEALELARLSLPPTAAAFEATLRRDMVFERGGNACTLARATPVPAGEGRLLARLDFDCALRQGEDQISIRLLFEEAGEPLHYLTVRNGAHRTERLLTRAVSRHTVAQDPEEGTGEVVLRYLGLGVHHILIGADHIAFLLCMLLVSPALAQRLWMITGFTLGHSLTLSLATLGLLRVQTAGVEALIGFSVALLAAEAFGRSRGGRLAAWLLVAPVAGLLLAAFAGRALLGTPSLLALLALVPAYLALSARLPGSRALHLGTTAVFGLVHGLGFAAVLHAIGLPETGIAWALASFNLGVEIGQLLLLVLLAGALGLLGRCLGEARRQAVEASVAAPLCALGIYWLVERTLA